MIDLQTLTGQITIFKDILTKKVSCKNCKAVGVSVIILLRMQKFNLIENFEYHLKYLCSVRDWTSKAHIVCLMFFIISLKAASDGIS